MKRIEALDALRGLAATTVVFSHVHGILYQHHLPLDLTPVRLLWAGGEAVILFFVLSGFVLSAPYSRSDVALPFGRFLATRLTRIYLPYLAAVALAAVLSWLLHDAAAVAAHPFLQTVWPHPVDWGLLASHALALGNFNTHPYDEPIWSLVHELRFALIFPLFILLLRRLSWRACLGLCAGLSIVACLASAAGLDPANGYKNSALYSLHYLLFFMLGGLLHRYSPQVGARVRALRDWQCRTMIAGGLLLYCYAGVLYSLPKKLGWREAATIGDFFADWGVAVAAALFIALAVHRPAVSTFLSHRLFVFLGRISFSLYLVHLLVLTSALFLLPRQSEVLSQTVALPVVFVAAIAFNRWIERPAHALGRRLFQGKRVFANEAI